MVDFLSCGGLYQSRILVEPSISGLRVLLQVGNFIDASHRIELRMLHLGVLHLVVRQGLALVLLVVLVVLKIVLHYYYKVAR